MKENTQQNIEYRFELAPEIRKDRSTGSRRVTFVASDSTRDSAGTVLNMDGWKLDRFNKNGIISYQHKAYGGWDDTANPDNVIGKGRAYLEGTGSKKRLLVDIEFEPEGMNELADKIYKKILFGTLKAVSVGFLPVGVGSWGKGEEGPGGKRPTYYYKGQELLEISIVNIPSNPNALKRAAGLPLSDQKQGSPAAGDLQKKKALSMAAASIALSNPTRDAKPSEQLRRRLSYANSLLKKN